VRRRTILRMTAALAAAALIGIAGGCSGASSSPPAAAEAVSPAAPESHTSASIAPTAAPDHPRVYPWLASHDPADAVAVRIARPAGCENTVEEAGSFGDWLRHLPLRKGTLPVRLFDGSLKANQDAHVAVVDIDTGTRNLQQCADSLIRLRAEHLFAAGRAADIHFDFTSGDRVEFARWVAGFTPVVRGSSVTWSRGQPREPSHATLRAYLDVIFQYAGTRSLARELQPVGDIHDMRIGDIFITPGSPGHAVIVVDMIVAGGGHGGRKLFMLAQGYMPAQDIHVLKNPAAGASPWYDLEFGDTLRTPEWTFSRTDLRRF